MTVGSLEWYLSVADTITALYRDELGRDPELAGLYNWIFHARENHRDGEWIRAQIRQSPEWHSIHDPKPAPAHKNPSTWSDEQLLTIRGSLNIKTVAPYGPRPDQPDNMASTNAPWIYTPEQRAGIRKAYKDRGYTHGPVGPFVDPGYHGQIPGIDIRTPGSFDTICDLLQEFWDDGIIPVVFIQNDGWTVDQMKALEVYFRDPKFQALARVVCNGFEQQGSKYGWSNQDYVKWLSWLKDVFPNAKRLLHTIADIEAPVGNGDDTSKAGMSNGDCWGRVAPLIHGWLHQSNALMDPGPTHVDPQGDGRTDEAHWFDLFDRNNKYSFISRFHTGYAGWPTTCAGPHPLKVYAGEFYSYYMWWKNASEDYARDHGAKAITLGADGSLDGCR